jgi:hypothetical protein
MCHGARTPPLSPGGNWCAIPLRPKSSLISRAHHAAQIAIAHRTSRHAPFRAKRRTDSSWEIIAIRGWRANTARAVSGRGSCVRQTTVILTPRNTCGRVRVRTGMIPHSRAHAQWPISIPPQTRRRAGRRVRDGIAQAASGPQTSTSSSRRLRRRMVITRGPDLYVRPAPETAPSTDPGVADATDETWSGLRITTFALPDFAWKGSSAAART